MAERNTTGKTNSSVFLSVFSVAVFVADEILVVSCCDEDVGTGEGVCDIVLVVSGTGVDAQTKEGVGVPSLMTFLDGHVDVDSLP